ncbi:MAG: hypothetical protein H6746_15035 [Deltaproteobacteria bacterium]|nr:hypothetical protein [Deltaproteobacteria bacterium]
MAVSRTDRDRRILGDRVVARAEEFRAIDTAVGRVLDGFIAQHVALEQRTAARLKEEGDDQKARRARDEAAGDAVRLYTWAYYQAPAMLGASWSDVVDDRDIDLVRQRLFPLGPPNAITVSHQRTLDGLIHLGEALGQGGLAFPDAFKGDVAATRDRLSAAIDRVTTDAAETNAATGAQLETRERWDVHWQALRDVTAAFLRLAGELSRHAGLFRPLARAGGGSAAGAPGDDEVTPGADGPLVGDDGSAVGAAV